MDRLPYAACDMASQREIAIVENPVRDMAVVVREVAVVEREMAERAKAGGHQTPGDPHRAGRT